MPGSMFEKVIKLWASRRLKALDQLLAVDFDDEEVRVRVLGELPSEWNQSFR